MAAFEEEMSHTNSKSSEKRNEQKQSSMNSIAADIREMHLQCARLYSRVSGLCKNRNMESFMRACARQRMQFAAELQSMAAPNASVMNGAEQWDACILPCLDKEREQACDDRRLLRFCLDCDSKAREHIQQCCDQLGSDDLIPLLAKQVCKMKEASAAMRDLMPLAKASHAPQSWKSSGRAPRQGMDAQ